MSIRINTNISALNIQRNLSRANQLVGKSLRRLSTGLRISNASDDAAGLAISERLRAQVRSLDQARRNSNDGISLVQTAEGALAEVSDILVRMRELSVQAANGTTTNADRDTLQQEFSTLRSEIDRIASGTEFNGINLLDGSATSISFQVGSGTEVAANQISLQLDSSRATSLGIDSADIGSGGDVSAAITSIDSAIDTVSSLRGRMGAAQNRLDSTVRNLSTQIESYSAAESRIRDVDFAMETANFTRYSLLQQASISLLGQAFGPEKSAISLLM